MGLSRLDNFLKNVKGEIIYVDSNNIDATDAVENQGNSLARPFKTLQRALIEGLDFHIKVVLIMIDLIKQQFYYIQVITMLTIDLDGSQRLKVVSY